MIRPLRSRHRWLVLVSFGLAAWFLAWGIREASRRKPSAPVPEDLRAAAAEATP
jgi:hypothetical protein